MSFLPFVVSTIGDKSIEGSRTGRLYLITRQGTWIHEDDLDDILAHETTMCYRGGKYYQGRPFALARPSAEQMNERPDEPAYILASRSEMFHTQECKRRPKKGLETSETSDELISRGFTPCASCLGDLVPKDAEAMMVRSPEYPDLEE